MKNRELAFHERVPCQPVVLDPEGVPRFRANRIVRWMLEEGRAGRRFDLDSLSRFADAIDGRDEYVQLMQLDGYSVSGYGELSFVPEEEVERADREAERVVEAASGATGRRR